MSNLDTVLEKIRKLRALSTSSNVHEASAAAAAADRLMQEHRIAEAQLESSEERETFIGDPDPLIRWNQRVTNWQSLLGNGLSKHYGCTGLIVNGNQFRIWGRPQDIATVRYGEGVA